MPRRELLTEPQRLAFTEPATEEREMVRHYTLSTDDVALTERAVDHLRRQGIEPEPKDLEHLSPLGWEHINLTGDYQWQAEESMNPDQFRPLRIRSADFAMAA